MNKGHILRTVTAGMITIVLTLYLAGCSTPLNHVGVFAQASADLAKQAANAYQDVNETTIERRIFDLAATAETPNEATFAKLIDDSNLAVRISLLRGVENYAKALGNLASADFRKEIDTASKDLYGALGGLQNTYTTATKKSLPLSNDNLAIIATAVDAIGTAIAEGKRREALKTVVIQTDPAIQESMKLVSEELPILKEILSANLGTIWTEKVKAYEKEATKLSFEERINRLRDIRKAWELTTNASAFLDNLSSASKKIADAHAALYEAVTNDKFTTDKLVKEVKNVVEISKSVKEFHDKLLTAEKQETKQ